MKDWRGTEIVVGSLVVYPTRHGSYMQMREGIVAEIHEEFEEVVYRNGSTGMRNHSWIKTKGTDHGKTVKPDHTRVTVISFRPEL